MKFAGKTGDGTLKILTEPDSLSFVVAENRESAIVTIAPAARPGIHWLRICNEFGATELKPFVVGLIPEVAETEPNAKLAEAQTVNPPSVTINGALEKAGDVDTYAIMLTGGRTLVAAMQARHALGSPMDGVLQILNGEGTVVAQNDDDTGPDPRIAFPVPADGMWYVRTFGFPATPNSTIGFAGGSDLVYRLTLTTESVIEHVSPLVRNDREPQTSLKLFGWNLQETVVTVPICQSILADGFALPTPMRTADFLSLTEDGLLENRVLSLPVAVTGHIETIGERDRFTFPASKDQQLSFSVDADSKGSMLDAVLSLHDSDGKLIREHDDLSDENQDSELHVTMPVDGVYQLTIRDRFSHCGERWFYLLRCEETRPSFSVTIKSTSLILTGDKPLDIPVTVDRRHGFPEAIEFRVDGLPEGVSAECPRSENGVDSAKSVTLRLRATSAPAFQGPIGITATSVDSNQLQAVTLETSDGSMIHESWLTVLNETAPP